MKLSNYPEWLPYLLGFSTLLAVVFLFNSYVPADHVVRSVILLPAGCAAAESLAIPATPATGGGIITEPDMRLDSHAIRLASGKALALTVVAGWSK